MRALLRLAVVALLAVSCGSDEADGVLSDAQDHLAELTEGRIDFSLTASAGGTGPVGFRIEGPFSFGDGTVPVLDLTYTRIRGDAEDVVRVRADGASVTVTEDGETTEVPERRLGALRLDDGAATGVDEFALSEWFDDVDVATSGDRTTLTGRADVPALLADLNRFVAEVAGEAGVGPLDDTAADRIEDAVRRATLTLTTEGDDHRLRTLEASLDFGARAPARLADALGRYARPRLDLRLEVADA